MRALGLVAGAVVVTVAEPVEVVLEAVAGWVGAEEGDEVGFVRELGPGRLLLLPAPELKLQRRVALLLPWSECSGEDEDDDEDASERQR